MSYRERTCRKHKTKHIDFCPECAEETAAGKEMVKNLMKTLEPSDEKAPSVNAEYVESRTESVLAQFDGHRVPLTNIAQLQRAIRQVLLDAMQAQREACAKAYRETPDDLVSRSVMARVIAAATVKPKEGSKMPTCCEICGKKTEELYGCNQCAKMVCEDCQSPIDGDYCEDCRID
jgi:hypothetical protein